MVDLAGRRDTLLADVDGLTQFESEYRARLSGVLESDLAMLRDRPSSAPGPVPQTHDVELPVASEAFARSDVAATDTDTDTDVDTDADSGVAAPAGVFTETFAAPDATSEADVAATDDVPFVAERHRQRDGSRHRCAVAVGHRLLRHTRGDPRSRGRGRSRDA